MSAKTTNRGKTRAKGGLGAVARLAPGGKLAAKKRATRKRMLPKSLPATVTSTEFASRFGHWSLKAQRTPVGVVNKKTGTTIGYFVSEEEFLQYLRVRDMLPRSHPIWEMDDDLIAELEKPLPADYPE